MGIHWAAKILLENFLYIVLLFSLQIYLCNKKNNYIGLVLPIGYFCYSIYLLFQVLSSNSFSDANIEIQILGAFVSPNINTVLLLLIYYFKKSR